MSPGRRRKRANRAETEPKESSVRGLSSSSTQGSPTGSAASVARGTFFERGPLWVLLGLTAANVAVYAAVWRFDFVPLDDPQYVYANPYVPRGLTWQGVWWAFTTGHAANWHPLVWLSLMLDVQLYGMKAGGLHLTNLLLHIANTVLLFGLLHRMTGVVGRSAFVAGLFAVHPLHVESVAWVTERKDVLSALFWMLTLWGYLWYVRQPRLGRYFAVLLFLVLSLMSKPMAVTLPFVLLLLDVWPLQRVSVSAVTDWRRMRRLVWEKVPLFAVVVASSIVTFIVQRRGGAFSAIDAIPLSYRLQNAVVSYVIYIGKMLWPARLAALYPYPRSLPGVWVAGALLVLIGVSIVVLRAGRRHPYLVVGWLLYLGMLVPMIGLVQVGSQAMADRYTYVPLIGLFLMVAWGVPELLANWRFRRVALAAAAGVVILGCALSARAQVQYWENGIRLWTHALEVTTENDLAQYNLGVALANQGRVDEAVAHYTEALRIRPDYVGVHNDLGIVLAEHGRVPEAITHFSEALRLKPTFVQAYNNLGKALEKQGKLDEAIAQYSEAVRIKADYEEAYLNLGLALARKGRLDEAIAQYSEALRIEPDNAEVHNSLGIALLKQGKLEEATLQFSEAVRIKPGYAEAHNNLGVAMANQGKVRDAVAHFSEAVHLNPNYTEARNNLRKALANQGKSDAGGEALGREP